MYRIGHGDCFLIAFASENPAKPAYVMIDCGYKPGSPGKLKKPTTAAAIGKHIIASTDGSSMWRSSPMSIRTTSTA